MKRVDIWQAQNPDRGNETEGITIALDGSRFWLTIAEWDLLVERGSTVRANAERKEAQR